MSGSVSRHGGLSKALFKGASLAMACLLPTLMCVPVFAQPSDNFELEWTSPPQCPQGVEVTDQIRAMLGAAPGTTLPSGLRAAGLIEPDGDRYQLKLRVRLGNVERERVIASSDCTSLGKAAAVVLGLLIRREHESGGSLSSSDLGSEFGPSAGTPSSVKPQPEEPPKPPPPSEPRESRADTNPRDWRLLVTAPTLSLDVSTLPKAGLGLGVAAGVRYRTFRGYAAATMWQEQRLERGGTEAYSALFTRTSFEAWFCRAVHQSSVEFAPCAVLAGDLIRATAESTRLESQPQSRFMPSLGLGAVGYLHATSWLSLFIATTGRIRLYRPVFEAKTLVGTDPTYTVPWATAVISSGLEWNF